MTKREDCFAYLKIYIGQIPVYVRSQIEARIVTPKGEEKIVDPSRLSDYSLDAKGDWLKGAINHLHSLNAQMQTSLSQRFSPAVVASMLEINQQFNSLLLMFKDLFGNEA